jgi:hypothetical protein
MLLSCAWRAVAEGRCSGGMVAKVASKSALGSKVWRQNADVRWRASAYMNGGDAFVTECVHCAYFAVCYVANRKEGWRREWRR